MKTAVQDLKERLLEYKAGNLFLTQETKDMIDYTVSYINSTSLPMETSNLKDTYARAYEDYSIYYKETYP